VPTDRHRSADAARTTGSASGFAADREKIGKSSKWGKNGRIHDDFGRWPAVVRRWVTGAGRHFSIDGALIESYASIKSFRPLDAEPVDHQPHDSNCFKPRHRKSPKTLGSDNGFDSGPYYLELEQRGIEPRSAMIDTPTPDPKHLLAGKVSAFEARRRMRERLATEAYRISQRCRKRWRSVSAG
jgi:hypothetical protein